MIFLSNKRLYKITILSALISVAAHGYSNEDSARAITQQEIPRVNQMSTIPKDLSIIDYKSLAQDFDKKVFDWNAVGNHWPVIWSDKTQKNFPQDTFGLYTAMGDVRQGPNKMHGKVHEAVAGMGAVLGGTLVGVDKSNQDGHDYVGDLKNYFGVDSNWNIMQNNVDDESGDTGGGYHRDWWYDIFPNVMFYAIADKYPDEKGFYSLQKKIADKFLAADNILSGEYGYSFFNYELMSPQTSNVPKQYDAAAGHSWVLYNAYMKFGDDKYLDGAEKSLQALENVKDDPRLNTPFYEVLMPFGAYMAARMNGEQGTHFDVQKMLDWSFNGKGGPRPDWGVIVASDQEDGWNGVDVSGMVGSTTDRGGYGFLMNTYDMAWPLVPMVRYDQSYANTIGKWMLHAANVAKMFYPQHMSQDHQALKEDYAREMSKDVIAYEGLIHDFHKIENVKDPQHYNSKEELQAPIAQGDGPGWVQDEEGNPINPASTELGVYGSAHVGIFGAIIQKTSVEDILQLDLLATDFYHKDAYPTFMYYNPESKDQTVKIDLTTIKANEKIFRKNSKVSIYDTVSAKWIKKGISSSQVNISIPASSSRVLVFVPSKSIIWVRHNRLHATSLFNILRPFSAIIDYHYQMVK